MELYSEGLSRFYVPRNRSSHGPGTRGSGLFFNEDMALSRDISVLFARVWARGRRRVRYLDGLAGVGARAIRMLNEAVEPGPEWAITVNDLDARSGETVLLSLRDCGMDREDIRVRRLPLQALLHQERFDLIDVDPFGTPAPFADSALQRVSDGGVVAFTATDTAVLCGSYPWVALRRYGARSISGPWCHELGIRVLLGYLARVAASHDRGMEVLLSHSTGHYLRVYVRLRDGAWRAQETLTSLGAIRVWSPNGWEVVRAWGELSFSTGGVPGSKVTSGPVWIGPLASKEVLKRVVDEERTMLDRGWRPSRRRSSLVETLSHELEEPPLFYDVDRLASELRMGPPSMRVIEELLRERGIPSSRTHCNPKGIKTPASCHELLSILQRTRRHPLESPPE